MTARARSPAQWALAFYQQNDQLVGGADATELLACVEQMQGNHSRARELHEESLRLWRRAEARQGPCSTLATPLHNLGDLALREDDLRQARQLFEAALAVSRQLGNDLSVATRLRGLGHVTELEGDLEAARSCYQQCLVLARQLGHSQLELTVLCFLAGVQLRRGETARASATIGEALTRATALGNCSLTTLCL